MFCNANVAISTIENTCKIFFKCILAVMYTISEQWNVSECEQSMPSLQTNECRQNVSMVSFYLFTVVKRNDALLF